MQICFTLSVTSITSWGGSQAVDAKGCQLSKAEIMSWWNRQTHSSKKILRERQKSNFFKRILGKISGENIFLGEPLFGTRLRYIFVKIFNINSSFWANFRFVSQKMLKNFNFLQFLMLFPTFSNFHFFFFFDERDFSSSNSDLVRILP
jgi:hypothetical protein